MYNPFLFPLFTPWLPNDCDKPPTIYSLLESIVNYGKDDKTKIKDLAKIGRTKIFDFDYPLSSKVNKEDFECMILNHFLMRRIGFDTLTAFKIQLNVKLNSIMPIYNKMFDLLEGIDFFGDVTIKEGTDKRNIDNQSQKNSNMENTTNNTLDNTSNSSSTTINDLRRSELPQSQIQNVKDSSYLTDYQYNTTDVESEDTSKSIGKSTSNTTNEETNNSNTTDNNEYQEKITNVNMLDVYLKLNQNLLNIYELIFKDLDCLFYQLI